MTAIDFTTPVGQLRLLISDVDESNQILTDEHVEGYLAMRGVADPTVAAPLAAIKRAAADALDAIATSEALVSKVIRTQVLSTNGPQTAAALREHATRLRSQADDDDTATSEEAGDFFGVAEFTPWPNGYTGEAAERSWYGIV